MSLYDMVSRIYQWAQSILSDVLGVSAAVKALKADTDAKLLTVTNMLATISTIQAANTNAILAQLQGLSLAVSQNQAVVMGGIFGIVDDLEQQAAKLTLLTQEMDALTAAVAAQQAVLQKILAAVTTPPAVSGRFVIGAEVPK